MNHAVERTSPFGEKFAGRCIHCGMEGLGLGAALDPCSGVPGVSPGDAILALLEPKEPKEPKDIERRDAS